MVDGFLNIFYVIFLFVRRFRPVAAGGENIFFCFLSLPVSAIEKGTISFFRFLMWANFIFIADACF